MPKRIDLTGQRFGRLTVLEYCKAERSGKRSKYRCLCDCGNETLVTSDGFTKTNSCGCLRVEQLRERSTTHGMSATPEFKAWCDMRERCNRKTRKDYARYGAIGITVCPRWMESFENFYADMGKKPSRRHSIDRVDNEKGYEPSNCRWATATIQRENQRRSKSFAFDGHVGTLKALASRAGISYTAVHQRVNTLNWSVDKALTTPLRRQSH